MSVSLLCARRLVRATPRIASRLLGRALIAALAIALLIPFPARAATLVINTVDDHSIPGDTLVTLREAILASINQTPTDLGPIGTGNDVIAIPAGLTGTVLLQTPLPALTGNLHIDGSASMLGVGMSGEHNVRIFHVATGASLTLTKLKISEGQSVRGGAILNEGSLTLINCNFANNIANGDGAEGGAVDNNGTFTATNTTFALNVATDSEANGTGGAGGGAIATGPGEFTATNCTFQSNLVSVTDLAGVASRGGALLIRAGSAPVSLTNCTIISSSITHDSGESLGAGIYTAVDATLIACMLRSNNAPFAEGSVSPPADASGGGLYVAGGNTALINSTISGNQVLGSGGGIAIAAGAACRLTNCTVVANVADSDANTAGDGGGISAAPGSTAQLRNSLIVANQDSAASTFAPDLAGEFVGGGSNLVGDAAGSSGLSIPDSDFSFESLGVASADAVVELVLASNGGPTQTHALVAGSAAIGRGNDSFITSPPFTAPFTDQRGTGYPRLRGAHVDIGAYEAVTPELSIITVNTLSSDQAPNNGIQSLYESIIDARDGTITDLGEVPSVNTRIIFAPGLTGTVLGSPIGPPNPFARIDTRIEILGPGADLMTIAAFETGSDMRLFEVGPTGSLTLKGLTLSGGHVRSILNRYGGAILSNGELILTRCRVISNTSANTSESDRYGGAIACLAGTLTIDQCSFENNSAACGEKWAARGGAIYYIADAACTITNSYFEGNSAQYGGGIIAYAGSLVIANSTFYANSVPIDRLGASAIQAQTGVPLLMVNCTVAGNSAGVGASVLKGDGVGDLRNCIIAGNTGINQSDASGVFLPNQHNLLGDPAGSSGFDYGTPPYIDRNLEGLGNIPVSDVLILPPASNGGPTKTIALTPASIARSEGNNGFATSSPMTGPPHHDQRGPGFPRILQGVVDLGAFEVDSPTSGTTGLLFR